jgi:hypothetical protein
MPWSGNTFSIINSFTPGTTILSSAVNANYSDIASGMTELADGSKSPQFASIQLGHASDTTLTRASAGVMAVEGKNVYMAGGTDVAVADGGTGSSTAAAARVALLPTPTLNNVLYGTGTDWGSAPLGDLLTALPGQDSHSLAKGDIVFFDGTVWARLTPP